MSILSFDQSLTRTGWCFLPMTTQDPLFSLGIGSFSPEGTDDFMVQAGDLMQAMQPDHVAFEEPLGIIKMYRRKDLGGDGFVAPNSDQLLLHRIAGHLEALSHAFGARWLSVSPKTWRAAVLGDGNIPRDRTKAAAKDWCAKNGIEVKNHDQAEAVCIAWYASSRPEIRYRQAE